MYVYFSSFRITPYDTTGVDLSTISVVPRQPGLHPGGGFSAQLPSGGNGLIQGDGFTDKSVDEVLNATNDHQMAEVTSCLPTNENPVEQEVGVANMTSPDTPFRTPFKYGCDFQNVTCSTPYGELDRPKRLSIRDQNKTPRLRMPKFVSDNIEESKTDSPSFVTMETEQNGHQVAELESSNRSSPSSGFGSNESPTGSTASKHDTKCTEMTSDPRCTEMTSDPRCTEMTSEPRSCDEHHSQCMCGLIGRLTPSDYEGQGHTAMTFAHSDEPFEYDDNISEYDNVPSLKPKSPQTLPDIEKPRLSQRNSLRNIEFLVSSPEEVCPPKTWEEQLVPKISPQIPREQYQSTDALERETALLRGLNTL